MDAVILIPCRDHVIAEQLRGLFGQLAILDPDANIGDFYEIAEALRLRLHEDCGTPQVESRS